MVVRKLPFVKAPSRERIHNVILRAVVRRNPGALLDVFNAYISNGVIPEP